MKTGICEDGGIKKLNDAEMLEALKTVDKYFKNLQNMGVLTTYEENVWKKVSKAIYKPD